MERGSIEEIGATFTGMNRHFEERYRETFTMPEDALQEELQIPWGANRTEFTGNGKGATGKAL